MADDGSPAGTVFPAFKYEDANGAIEWLERAFGFARGLVVPGPNHSVAHAELGFPGGGVMLGSLREPSPGDPWADRPFGVYIAVEDIDAHYERAKAAGAAIADEIHDTDYGSREYSALDPAGNIWCFGTYRPGEAEV